MTQLARFYASLFVTNLKSVTALRGSFLLSMTFMALNNLTFFVFWWVLFSKVGSVRGWHMADVELLFGVSAAGFGLMQAVAGGAVHLSRFIDEGAVANIKRWNQAVEITACRAGLIVSGDLEIAKKIIAAEQQLPGDLTAAEKMKELLLYFVSDEYSQLRKALGIAVVT